MYINTLGGGGAERVISQLANRFDAENCDVTMIASLPVEDEYPVSASVKKVYLEPKEEKQSWYKRNVVRVAKLRELCKKQRPDVLIAFMLEANARAILATIGLPTKVIVSVRNDPEQIYGGRLGRIVGKHILPRADGCVFQTAQAKSWFPQKLQAKSAIILNAVADSFFDVQRERTANVITVGRLCSHKNQSMLIRAFAKIADRYPNQNLVIYGDGDYRKHVERQIADLKLENRVHLMGKTSKVSEALARASVFVLPSDFEGMPNALLEAMAVGVPSISTDCPCGGPAMLIRHGENGLLVPVKDEDALADAMDRLLSDISFAEALGKAAKKDAEAYRPEKVFEKWKAYIERIINGTN